MPWSKPVYSQKSFLTVEYTPDIDGILKSPKPKRCPAAEEGKDGACHITIHGYRNRKHGPGHKLTILLCKSHKLAFTVYPVDWHPFGRHPLTGEGSTFDAIEDASAGKLWPETANTACPTAKTQSRWVQAWSKLLGLCPTLSLEQAHIASICLEIPTIYLRKIADKIRAGPTMKGRAKAIKRLFSTHRLTHKSLSQQGHEVGYWGKPIAIISSLSAA